LRFAFGDVCCLLRFALLLLFCFMLLFLFSSLHPRPPPNRRCQIHHLRAYRCLRTLAHRRRRLQGSRPVGSPSPGTSCRSDARCASPRRTSCEPGSTADGCGPPHTLSWISRSPLPALVTEVEAACVDRVEEAEATPGPVLEPLELLALAVLG
jgi:hypothetical protein